jgi:hypothetical protein
MENQETLHPIDSWPRLNAFTNKAMTAMMKKKSRNNAALGAYGNPLQPYVPPLREFCGGSIDQ